MFSLSDFMGISRTTVGLHISEGVIRIIEVKTSKGSILVTKAAELEIPPGSIEDEHFISDTLKKTWKSKKFSKARIVSLFDTPALETVQLRVPLMPAKELQATIGYRAATTFSLPLEDCEWDYLVLGEVVEKNIRKQDVLLAAAPREKILAHISMLKKAGLRPYCMHIIPLSLIRTYLQTTSSREIVAFINIGRTMTNMTIVDEDILRFTRDIPVGSQRIVTALKKTPLPDVSAGGRSPVIDDPALEMLISEIGRSFDYYRTRPESKKPSRIVLSGEKEAVAGLRQYLKKLLNMEVDCLRTFKDVPVNLRDPLLNKLVGSGEEFGAHLGLALYETGINLLPPKARWREFSLVQRLIQACGVVIIISFAIVTVDAYKRLNHIAKELRETLDRIETITPIITGIDTAKRQKDEMKRWEAEFQKLSQNRLLWSEVLQETAKHVPPDMTITSLSYDMIKDRPSLRIEGTVSKDRLATEFLLNLGRVRYFGESDLDFTRTVPAENGVLTTFQITSIIKQ